MNFVNYFYDKHKFFGIILAFRMFRETNKTASENSLARCLPAGRSAILPDSRAE